MKKALNIAALLFVLTALAFGLVGCDGNADQAKADEMLGTDVKLNGTWKSQTVTYTHDGKQYSGQIELRFNDDQMQIVAPYGTSKIHRYTRNGIALNVTDPYISEDNPYRTFPFALEFDSVGFAVDLGALTFMEGADNIKLKFTKTSDLPGDFSENVPSTGDIRTKSDLLASIPGVLIPPSSGLKDPDESTVSLVNSVLDRLNKDYDGKTHDNDSDYVYTVLGIFEGDSANGYLFCVIKYSSEDGDEETYNGKITSNGNVIVFDDAKYKKNVSTGNYSEGGSVTVNGKSVGLEYAMNLIPEDDNSVREYWGLCVDPYRSGTYSVFSGSERQNNILACSDSIVVLDIATNGHMVQIKYTCPSDVSSFRYGPDCKLDYVAVDGSFYNTAKFQKVFDKLPADIKLSSTLMEFDTFAEIQGRNLQLTAEITLRDGGTSKDVVWETPEDTSVFKVQSMADGILTFQICKSGTYVISAHADYEGQHFKTAQCVITTNDALTQLRIYDVTNDNTYTDDNGTIELRKGQTVELSPIYTPTSTPQLDVLWCMDNASVVTVSGRPNHKAVLTAVGSGTATLTLMSQENTSIRRRINVVVVEEPEVPEEPETPEVPEAPISDNIHYGLMADELPKDLSDISLTVVYQEEDGTPVRLEDSVDLMLHAGEELTSWYLGGIENGSVEQYVPEGKVYFEGSFPVENNGYYILSYYIYGTNENGEKVLGYSCAESHRYTGSSLDTEIRSSASAEYDYGLITAKAEGACYAKIEGHKYVVVLPGTPVTFTSKENLSSYWWYLNGTTETETSSQYTLECPKASDGSWMYGIYRVSCAGTGSGSSSSVDVIFTPNKDMEKFDWSCVL